MRFVRGSPSQHWKILVGKRACSLVCAEIECPLNPVKSGARFALNPESKTLNPKILKLKTPQYSMWLVLEIRVPFRVILFQSAVQFGYTPTVQPKSSKLEDPPAKPVEPRLRVYLDPKGPTFLRTYTKNSS